MWRAGLAASNAHRYRHNLKIEYGAAVACVAKHLVMPNGPVCRNGIAIAAHENERKGTSSAVCAGRLRSKRPVDEEVGNPARGNAEAEAAAIFEPTLVGTTMPSPVTVATMPEWVAKDCT
jgi:hypothetical protein